MSEKGNFIITLGPGATADDVKRLASGIQANGGIVRHQYLSKILMGLAVTVTPEHLNSFQGDKAIKYIEPDGVVRAT